MRVLLAELAPRRGDVDANIERVRAVLRSHPVDLAVFPELFLSGYALGDRIHRMALAPDAPAVDRLREIARAAGAYLAIGVPWAAGRPGEVENAALLVGPAGLVGCQVKRYLPSFGPFEEGQRFSAGREASVLSAGPVRIGIAICYDTFFPETFRPLARQGAEILVVLSASPLTSRPLFERLLPARAIENACPVLYANRVGVEDGIVFGGGSGAWDVRGERMPWTRTPAPGGVPEEGILVGELDPGAARRWRPFRPVLRDQERSGGLGE